MPCSTCLKPIFRLIPGSLKSDFDVGTRSVTSTAHTQYTTYYVLVTLGTGARNTTIPTTLQAKKQKKVSFVNGYILQIAIKVDYLGVNKCTLEHLRTPIQKYIT